MWTERDLHRSESGESSTGLCIYVPDEVPKPLFSCGRWWFAAMIWSTVQWSERDNDDEISFSAYLPLLHLTVLVACCEISNQFWVSSREKAAVRQDCKAEVRLEGSCAHQRCCWKARRGHSNCMQVFVAVWGVERSGRSIDDGENQLSASVCSSVRSGEEWEKHGWWGESILCKSL